MPPYKSNISEPKFKPGAILGFEEKFIKLFRNKKYGNVFLDRFNRSRFDALRKSCADDDYYFSIELDENPLAVVVNKKFRCVVVDVVYDGTEFYYVVLVPTNNMSESIYCYTEWFDSNCKEI